MTKYKVTVKYSIIVLIAVFFSFFFHELSHWLAGELLGYKMTMRLNNVSLSETGISNTFLEKNLISAAGPIFTIAQSIFFYFLMKKYKNIHFYPFVFLPFFMRLLAFSMSFITLNDEARISRDLGLGTYTLFIIVCLFLGTLLFKITKEYSINLKFILYNFLLSSIFTTLLIVVDNYFKFKIIN